MQNIGMRTRDTAYSRSNSTLSGGRRLSLQSKPPSSLAPAPDRITRPTSGLISI